MRRYLVIANRTLCEQHLLDELHRRRTADPGCRFHLVVPATHPPGTFTDEQCQAIARAQLNEALDTMAVAGTTRWNRHPGSAVRLRCSSSSRRCSHSVRLAMTR